MNWRKFNLTILWIISISGLLFNWATLMGEYLEYSANFNYDVKSKFTTKSVSSKLDICFPQPEHLTTVESVWSRTAEVEEAVKLIKTLDHFNTTVEKFTRGHSACYSVDATFNGGCPYAVPHGPIFEVQLESNDTESEELKLYLHAPDKSMNSRYTQLITLPRMYLGERKNLHVTLSYSLIHRLLLPHPYFPGCKTTKERRVDECLNKQIIEEFGPAFASYFTQMNSRSNRTFRKNDRRTLTTCGYHRYRSDCVEYIFVPKVISVVPSLVDKVVLIPEKTPVIAEVAEPIMPLCKLYIEMLNSLVYWFAISPIPYLVIEALVKRLVAQKYQSF